MKRTMILAAVLLLITGTLYAAFTNPASGVHWGSTRFYGPNGDLADWMNETEDYVDGTTAMPGGVKFGSVFWQKTDTTPTAAEGWMYFDDSENCPKFHNGTGWVALTAGTGDNTLDNAYDQGGAGAGKTITADTGAVTITNTDTDTAFVLSLTPTPSGSAALGGLQITSGANATEDSLQIVNGGSGDDIQAGAGAFKVSAAGVVTAAGATVAGTVSVNDSATTSTTSIGGGTTTGAVSVATGASAQTVNIATGAGVKTAALGSTNTTSSTAIQSGSNGVNVNVSNNQPTNINTGTSTGAVTVGGTGAMSISIGAGGTGAKTIAIGDAASTGATTIKAGTGGMNISVNAGSGATAINTGTTSGTLTVGSASNNTQISSANVYFGASDTDVPTIWYGETAGAEMTATGDIWTYDGLTVIFNEGDAIQFGDGGDLSLSSTTNLLTLGQVVSGTGTFAIGVDNKGIDTTWYAETATDKMWWDQDGSTNVGALTFANSSILFDQANADYTLVAASDNLGLTATDHASSKLTIGSTGTNGLDLVWQTHTAGAEVTADAGADTITIDGVTTIVNEGDLLEFGDGGDVSLSSTSNVLTIGQVVSGTGEVALGVNNKGLDFTFYAETDGDSLKWDQDGATNLGALIFEDSVLQFAGANVAYSTAISTDALAITATDHANAQITIAAAGGTTNGIDVVWNAHTSGATVTLNGGDDTATFDAVDIVMNDNDSINFGDSSAESTLLSDGSGTDWTLTNGALTIGDGGTTNYSSFAASTGALTFVGTARPSKGKYIPAQDFTAIAGSPVLTTEIGTNKAIGWALDDSAAPEEGIATTFTVPDDWASGTDVTVNIYWATSDASGTGVAVVWDVNTIPLASDEDISGATIIVDTATDNLVSGTAWDLNVSQAITVAASTEWTAGDLVSFMLFRDSDNAADDVTGDAVVLGVKLTYTSDKP